MDILLVDTGDRIEGNGLYDASEPKGLYTFDIFKQQNIDIVTSGNHELYKANSSNNEFFKTVPNFKGNYLASNLDVRDNKTGELVPLAPRYKKFVTKNRGIRIIAFGFMFNFQGSSNNTVVTPVQETIKQDWFKDAIHDRDVDLFVVAGHVGLRMEEFKLIFNAIRAEQWDTPIQFLGGHTHIRDYAKYDSKAYGIESGRYMETIGFASIDGLKLKKKKDEVDVARSSPKFNRRYIDNNLFSYYTHTGLNETSFPTEVGVKVTKQIADARKAMKLDDTHGCAPRDLWLNRAGLNSDSSIFSWLGGEVLLDEMSTSGNDASPKLVITNTGAIRFDIFKGPFTKDTTYLIAPFTSGFRLLKGVKYETAAKVLQVLNSNGQLLQQIDPTLDSSLLVPPPPIRIEDLSTATFPDEQVALKTHKDSLTPGYTTKDDLGSDGDDTEHSAISYFNVPNCIQTEVDFPADGTPPETVSVVYNEFIEPWLILALKFLGASFEKQDTEDYLDGKSLTEIINDWVEHNWPCAKSAMDEL